MGKVLKFEIPAKQSKVKPAKQSKVKVEAKQEELGPPVSGAPDVDKIVGSLKKMLSKAEILRIKKELEDESE